MDSNLIYIDSNPSWRTSEKIEALIRITYTVIQITYEEQDKAIRIFELQIRIHSQMKQKAESQTERFESSSYWFESLH